MSDMARSKTEQPGDRAAEQQHSAANGGLSQEEHEALAAPPVERRDARIESAVAATAFLIVLGGGAATALLWEGGPEAWHRVILGYGVGVGALALSWFTRARQEAGATRSQALSHIFLGVGLAATYFTTYAAFFAPSMQIFTGSAAAWPLLAVCLLLFLALTLGRTTQIAANIALFFIYYTVAASSLASPTAASLAYALSTCTTMAVAVPLFRLFHVWRAFTWLVMLGNYAAFFFAFYEQPEEFVIGEERYTAILAVLASINFLALAAAFMVDVLRSGRSRGMLLASALNAALYLVWLIPFLQTRAPQWLWPVLAGAAAALAVVAAAGGRFSARTSTTVRFHAAAAFVLLLLALPQMLAPLHRWSAIGLSPAVFAAAYGFMPRKGLALLAIAAGAVAAAGALPEVAMPGAAPLFGSLYVSAAWFVAGGTSLALFLGAWAWDRVAQGEYAAGQAAETGYARAAALLTATAGALLILCLCVYQYPHDPALPLIVTGTAAGLLIVGWTTGAQALQAVAMPLLAAALLVWMLADAPANVDGAFENPLNGLAIAAAALAAAPTWQRFLKADGRPDAIDYEMLASLPAATGSAVLATLLYFNSDPANATVIGAAAALTFFIVSLRLRWSGLRFGALLLLLASTLQAMEAAANSASWIPPLLIVLTAGSIVAAERLVHLDQRRGAAPGGHAHLLRTFLAAAAAAAGASILMSWLAAPALPYGYAALALLVAALGAVIGERRYLFAAALPIAMGAGQIVAPQVQEGALWPALALVAAAAAAGYGLWRAYGTGSRGARGIGQGNP
jgi:hypothetical protein